MALQAAFRTGSIFEACDDIFQTGDAYSAAEKHRARTVMRIVLVTVPQVLVFANLIIEDAVPDSGLCLGLSNVVFVREASV